VGLGRHPLQPVITAGGTTAATTAGIEVGTTVGIIVAGIIVAGIIVAGIIVAGIVAGIIVAGVGITTIVTAGGVMVTATVAGVTAISVRRLQLPWPRPQRAAAFSFSDVEFTNGKRPGVRLKG
jgi:hypothetical protein